MDIYLLNSIMIISAVGIIIKVVFSQTTYSDGTQGPAAAALCGYGVVSIAMLLLMVISCGLASNAPQSMKTNSMAFIMHLINYSLPSILTFAVLMWLMVINFMYYNKINEGEVANEYNSFSTASTLLIIIQLGALFKYLIDEHKNLGSGLKITKGIYILTILNMIFAGIMNIIAMFFSTDG